MYVYLVRMTSLHIIIDLVYLILTAPVFGSARESSELDLA